jgi:hypothetical protein
MVNRYHNYNETVTFDGIFIAYGYIASDIT